MTETPESGWAWENPTEPVEGFLRDVESRLALPPDVRSADAVSAVFCALSQRMSARELARTFARLPSSVHALVRRCPLHHGDSARAMTSHELLGRIAGHLGVETEDAALILRQVLAAARNRVTPREVRRVADRLPADVREAWLAPLG